MLTLLLHLALAPPALAQDPADECPVHPDDYAARVQALRELVAFAEPAAGAELTQLELLLVACVDGPVSRQTLTQLLLAQGAYEVLREGGDAERADRYLGYAAALGGAAAWDEVYGPDVQKRFNAAVKRRRGEAVLDLSFAEPVQAVSLDGEAITQYGLVRVPAGRHVVQWSTDEGWRADVVEVEAGQRRLVGGGAPTPVPELLPGDAPPVEGEEDDWREPLGTFSFALSGGADLASGVVHYDGVGGEVSVVLPRVGLEAWYRGMGWWLGLDGAFTGAADTSGLALPRHAGLTAGLAWGERLSGRFGVGLVAASLPLPSLPEGSSWAPPTFALEPSLGGRGLLELSYGERLQARARVEAALLSAGLTAGGELGLGFQVGPVAPYLGAGLGTLSRRGADDLRYARDEAFAAYDRDTYNWIQVEGGLWTAF